MSEHLLHDSRYSSFVISGEDDLQCFSAVHRMHLERKNIESFVLAQLEVSELCNRDIRDDSAEVVQVPGVLTRRRFFLRDQDKLALGDQERAGGRKLAPESADHRRPLGGGQQALSFGPITLRLVAEMYRPGLGY